MGKLTRYLQHFWRKETGTAAVELTPAAADAPIAARMKEDGAVIFAKTTCPDYGMLSSGLSSFHPLSRNPWDLTQNPGGSSAGAGEVLEDRRDGDQSAHRAADRTEIGFTFETARQFGTAAITRQAIHRAHRAVLDRERIPRRGAQVLAELILAVDRDREGVGTDIREFRHAGPAHDAVTNVRW